MREDELSLYRTTIVVDIKAYDIQSARQLAFNVVTTVRNKKHPSMPKVRVVMADVAEVRSA